MVGSYLIRKFRITASSKKTWNIKTWTNNLKDEMKNKTVHLLQYIRLTFVCSELSLSMCVSLHVIYIHQTAVQSI